MLNAIVNTVIDTLREGGVEALYAYPEREIDRHGAARVLVSVKGSESRSGGFGGYLGIREDPARGESPVFGHKLDAAIALMIYAPESGGAARCTELFSAASEAMLRLPRGIKARSLKCSAAAPDLKTGMFKCEAELSVSAYFVCAIDEEANEFLDFELIGVVKNGL